MPSYISLRFLLLLEGTTLFTTPQLPQVNNSQACLVKTWGLGTAAETTPAHKIFH